MSRYFLHVILLIGLILGYGHGKEIKLEVEEETVENYHVGVLSTEISEVNFHKIESSNDGSIFFNVDQATGEVKVKQRIDREKICPTSVMPHQSNFGSKIVDGDCVIKFEVNVIEKATQNLHDAIIVYVTITDINDNACYFEPSRQIVEIEENARPDEAKILINMPKDPDSERLGYGIDKKNIRILNNDYFVLDPIREGSKRIYLTLTKPLDYELMKEINLTLESNNYNANVCKLDLQVVIKDVNDNHPIFMQNKYELDLSEDTPVNSVLLTLKANDQDSGEHGKIIYEIDNQMSNLDYRNFLRINNENGSIILQRKLNFNDVKELRIFVNAKNVKDPKVLADVPSASIAEVIMRISDLNDHAPVIKVLSISNYNQNLTIEEELEQDIKKDIARVSVSDEDDGRNAHVQCKLDDLSGKNFLSLVQVDQKIYKIVIEKRVDREQFPQIPYQIKCEDKGQPPLSQTYQGVINVLDVNDNPPEFVRSEYVLEVLEDSADERRVSQYKISQFHALDKDIGNNGNIEYSIVDSNSEALSFFTIDRSTGVLFSQGNLDHELIDIFQFKVQAKDDGVNSLASTTDVTVKVLDYNDNKPKFDRDSYTFVVTEHSPKNTFIGSVFIEDKDVVGSSKITADFKRTEEKASMVVKIVSEDLTYNFMHNTEMKESASDWFLLKPHQISKGSIRVDIYVKENIDRERFYRDLISNRIETSSLNPTNTRPTIEFDLVAKDSGSPRLESLALVKVVVLDLNDNAPVLKHSPNQNNGSTNITEITVSINEAPGFHFTRVEMEDFDAAENGTVKYRIISGNSQGLFEIDEITGKISLAEPKGYSSLLKITYPLTIRATDSSHIKQQSTEIRLHIKVDDSEPINSPSDFYNSRHRRMNFLIIIAIVTASFIVSTVLLTSICIVLKKAKNDSHLTGRHSGFKPSGFYDIQKNHAPSIGSNQPRNDESSLLYFSGNGKIFSQENSDYGGTESGYYQQGTIGYPCSPDGTVMNVPGTFTMKETPKDPRFATLYRKSEGYGTYSAATLASPSNSNLSWSQNMPKINQMNMDKLYEDQDSGNGDSLETAITSKPIHIMTGNNQLNLPTYSTQETQGIYFAGNHQLSQSILELNAEPVMRFISDPKQDNKCPTLTSSFV